MVSWEAGLVRTRVLALTVISDVSSMPTPQSMDPSGKKFSQNVLVPSQSSVPWPLMLHSFCCEVIDLEKTELSLIGGGGNCFSFGTHFNRQPVTIGLGSFLNEQSGQCKSVGD